MPPDEHFSDIAVRWVGFQMIDLEPFTRPLIVRDRDVGGFVALFDTTK